MKAIQTSAAQPPSHKGSRSFLTFDDLDDDQLSHLLNICHGMAVGKRDYARTLVDKKIGILFLGPSTRTRTSFNAAVLDLGAAPFNFSKDETQLSTGETIQDTGRILSLFLDGLVIRSNGPLADMRSLAHHGLPVVNAMSDCEHPTQALADYAAICRHFGDISGLRIAYYGEGNNTVVAISKLFSRLPNIFLDLYMPEKYSLSRQLVLKLEKTYKSNSGQIKVFHHVPDAIEPADIVYCTRWRTMGQPHPDPNWLSEFAPFSMTMDLFIKASNSRGVFMHDLPAVREEDVSSDVLDSARSIAWDQAFCKKIGAAASLVWSQNN